MATCNEEGCPCLEVDEAEMAPWAYREVTKLIHKAAMLAEGTAFEKGYTQGYEEGRGEGYRQGFGAAEDLFRP
jgi:flagellar biosynthesis/type III secretory pathway protein FliH